MKLLSCSDLYTCLASETVYVMIRLNRWVGSLLLFVQTLIVNVLTRKKSNFLANDMISCWFWCVLCRRLNRQVQQNRNWAFKAALKLIMQVNPSVPIDFKAFCYWIILCHSAAITTKISIRVFWTIILLKYMTYLNDVI